MALHRIQLPPLAHRLFRVVALQRRLLHAMAQPTFQPALVNEAWLLGLWPAMSPTWIHQFGLGGQLDRIVALAHGAPQARGSLLTEFSRQNKVLAHYQATAQFSDLSNLPGFTPSFADTVKTFFLDCYDKMGHKTANAWPGYDFQNAGSICKVTYTDAFRSMPVTCSICPYCDRDLGTAILDHYYPKAEFPLISCSPWNLFPVCDSCNKPTHQGGKGIRPPLDPTSRSAAGWLHPIARPASSLAHIRLSGQPPEIIPQLSSVNPAEQVALSNHQDLIRSLAPNWTRRASGYLEHLIARKKTQPQRSVDDIIGVEYALCCENRGKTSNTLIDAAVCRAVLDRRPGYIDEFVDSNPPKLV